MRLQTARAVAGCQDECGARAEILRIGESVVLAVADGVGGISGGARAAELAIEYIVAGARAMPPDAWADHSHWDSLLSGIDAWLAQDEEAGETTAVVAAVCPPTIPELIVGSSVGDSGAWLIAADGYEDLMENQRTMRLGFLGSGDAMPFWFSERFGDNTLLLATDGLWKYGGPDSICRICRDPDIDSATRRLIELVRLSSGALQDDVAVSLCRVIAE